MNVLHPAKKVRVCSVQSSLSCLCPPESRSLRHREELVLLDTGKGRLYNPLTGLSARAFGACYAG